MHIGATASNTKTGVSTPETGASAGPTARLGACSRGDPAGKLDGDGAPRWKQRAFYDALKDTGAGNEIGVAIARVAIYDPIDGALLEDVLERRAVAEPAAVLALVEQRTVAGHTS